MSTRWKVGNQCLFEMKCKSNAYSQWMQLKRMNIILGCVISQAYELFMACNIV